MNIYKAYAVNKSDAEVQLIDGSVKIPIGGWRGLTAREVEHEDIIYALRREWIVVQVDKPTTLETPPKKPLDYIETAGKDPGVGDDGLPANLKSVDDFKEGSKVEEVKTAPKKSRIPKP